MNEFDDEQFEAELQTLRLTRPPQKTLDRVVTELSAPVQQRSQSGSIIAESVGWATAECARPRAQHASSGQGRQHYRALVRGCALRRPRTGALRLGRLSSRLVRKLPIRGGWDLLRWARWAVPAAAAVTLIVLLLEHRGLPAKPSGSKPLASSAQPVLKADNVEIDRQWIADFDAIAQLPNGNPVRFRCEQWLDKVRLRDSVAGLAIERTIPRLEIVPVRMETY